MSSSGRDISQYIANPDEFPILREWDFFNHAAVSPLPRKAADALRWYAQHIETHAYMAGGFYKQIEQLRSVAANFINATPEEIALVKNTSEGLATVANAIDWKPGDRIVTTFIEFPANLYPWMDVAKQHAVELHTVPPVIAEGGSLGIPTQAILASADHPRTRLLTISHVQYSTGQRHDLTTLGNFCRQRNILFCVDAIQSLGALPLDVRQMNIDYLSADGHKWLLGPEGAGIFFCRQELLAQTRPALIGWMNVINHLDYSNYDFTLKSDARKFECGTHNVPGLLALKASFDLLMEVGIEAIAQRIKVLTDRLVERLNDKGYQVMSPRENEQWSGIVTFVSKAHDHQAIWRKLSTEHRTEIALRDGRLRVSPHFYNTEDQIDRLVDRLP